MKEFIAVSEAVAGLARRHHIKAYFDVDKVNQEMDCDGTFTSVLLAESETVASGEYMSLSREGNYYRVVVARKNDDREQFEHDAGVLSKTLQDFAKINLAFSII